MSHCPGLPPSKDPLTFYVFTGIEYTTSRSYLDQDTVRGEGIENRLKRLKGSGLEGGHFTSIFRVECPRSNLV